MHLLSNLVSDLVLLSLIQLGCDAVRKVAFDSQSVLNLIFVIAFCLLSMNETLLGFWSAVESPELLHRFHCAEIVSVEVLAVTDSAADAIKHDLSERYFTESEAATCPDVDAECGEAHDAIQEVPENIVDLCTSMALVFQLELLLV